MDLTPRSCSDLMPLSQSYKLHLDSWLPTQSQLSLTLGYFNSSFGRELHGARALEGGFNMRKSEQASGKSISDSAWSYGWTPA